MNADHSGRPPFIKVCLTPDSLAAIETFFRHQGLQVSPRFVLEYLATNRRLTTLDRVAILCNELGLNVRVFQGSLDDLLCHPPACLVCAGTGELVYSDDPVCLMNDDQWLPEAAMASRRWSAAWVADASPPPPRAVAAAVGDLPLDAVPAWAPLATRRRPLPHAGRTTQHTARPEAR